MALNWIRVNHRSLDNWCLNNERCRAALADAHCVMRSSRSSPLCLLPASTLPACYSRSCSSSWAEESVSSSAPLPSTPLSLLIALKPFLTYVLGQGLWAVAIQNSACCLLVSLSLPLLTVQLKCHVPPRPWTVARESLWLFIYDLRGQQGRGQGLFGSCLLAVLAWPE